MANITLAYVREIYDPAALFIVSKNTNNNIVVYSGSTEGVRLYWLNLEPDARVLQEPLNGLELTTFGLKWIGKYKAYFEKFGTDRLITFTEDYGACWAEVAGQQRQLVKIYAHVENMDWFILPVISHVVLTSHDEEEGYMCETIVA